MTKTSHDQDDDPGYDSTTRFDPIILRLATNETRDPVGSKRQVFRKGWESGWRAAIRYMSDIARDDTTKNLAKYGPVGRERSGGEFDELVRLGTPGLVDEPPEPPELPVKNARGLL